MDPITLSHLDVGRYWSLTFPGPCCGPIAGGAEHAVAQSSMRARLFARWLSPDRRIVSLRDLGDIRGREAELTALCLDGLSRRLAPAADIGPRPKYGPSPTVLALLAARG